MLAIHLKVYVTIEVGRASLKPKKAKISLTKKVLVEEKEYSRTRGMSPFDQSDNNPPASK